MDFLSYEKEAYQHAAYPNLGLGIYPSLGLAGEVGELVEKIKKIHRDHNGEISEENKNLLAKEAGDVLWYLANFCREIGFSLEEIAKINVAKIKDRRKRCGEGDCR